MKRFFCLLLAAVFILSACAADEGLRLKDLLAEPKGGVYSSPFGITIDLNGLSVLTAGELAEMSALEGSDTEDALTREMDKGNAVAILSATAETDSLTMTLIPTDKLPQDARTADLYADYTAEQMPGKLEALQCTNVQVNRTYVILGETEYPAVYVSCNFVDGSPYYLLQFCFGEGGWMGGLSVTSLESPIAIQELLNHVTTSE